jgi:hypothetical protein
MSLIRSIIPRRPLRATVIGDSPLSFDQWASMFSFGSFPLILNPLNGKEEIVSDTFSGLVQGAYKSNGIVFACELARIMLFSEARFQFRRRESGRPGELFGTSALLPLEQPADGVTTGNLLTRALQHADFGGTAFVVRRPNGRLRQPRPDWVTMVYGSYDDPAMTAEDIDADFLGIVYHPGGRYSDQQPEAILATDVGVFAPIPDPIGMRRGIPWLTPIIREIMADSAATTHKLKFFENGATPQMIVSLDKGIVDPAKFRQWVEVLEQDHKGVSNAYKTLYLGAGAQATVVGANLQQLDFKVTQGAGETRIAAAAGSPPVVVGLSEGLQGSSLNAGNFGASMRKFADLFGRPAWRDFAGAMSKIIDVPAGAELWYDDRDIPALKDDVKDAAEVQNTQATAIRTLSDGGFEPQSVVDSIIAGDWKRLKHTGKLSVQLQEPGAEPARQLPSSGALALLGTGEVRCPSCDKLVAKRTEVGGAFEVKCRHCGELVAA